MGACRLDLITLHPRAVADTESTPSLPTWKTIDKLSPTLEYLVNRLIHTHGSGEWSVPIDRPVKEQVVKFRLNGAA